MKLSLSSIAEQKGWEGDHLPAYNPVTIRENTEKSPRWLHFGPGNIFRIFPAVLCQRLIEEGKMDTGIVSVEGYDDEVITKCFHPYDNLVIGVTLNADGNLEKEVVASVTHALTMLHNADKVKEIFCNPSLQMVSFTITEKGYSLRGADGELAPAVKLDMAEGPEAPKSFMAQLASMCLARKAACGAPLSLVSMDNCSHNGEKLQGAILEIAKAWLAGGKIGAEEYDYLATKIAFPWSMIDKITPRPDAKVMAMLQEDGFEDTQIIETAKQAGFAPIHHCAGSFEEAVHMARDLAEPGDTVLLSPACASWDMFPNFEVRGRVFKEIVTAWPE